MAQPVQPPIFVGNRWSLRFATPDDNGRLLELFKTQTAGGPPETVEERDPDFFALHGLHLGQAQTFIIETSDGVAVGSLSVVVRTAWFAGSVRPVGYLGDLRYDPERVDGATLSEANARVLEHVATTLGVELFYAVLHDTDQELHRELRESVEGQPQLHPMFRFNAAAVRFAGPVPAPEGMVARATVDDVPDLLEFLVEQHRQFLFGDVFEANLLVRRVEAWSGLSLESFYIARSATGRMIGCAAPWDVSPFKRTRVTGHRGSLEMLRPDLEEQKALEGLMAMPRPGEKFRCLTLTHTLVRDEDPDALRDLLRAVYRDFEGEKLHYFAVPVERDSPLEEALEGFEAHRAPMTVYAITLPGSPWLDFNYASYLPGFELALL